MPTARDLMSSPGFVAAGAGASYYGLGGFVAAGAGASFSGLGGVHLLLTNRFLERMGELLFDDFFRVERVNPDGKKFDKVTRIEARSEKCGMFMQLDVNTEIYPIDKEERFLMALSTTLSLEGGRQSLADKFEYIMHGKLYKISDGGSGAGVKVEIYVSFGGLQMMLQGDPSHCAGFELEQQLFLLMRKLT